MAIELSDAGARHLAVSLGTATRGAALTRILALRGAAGWIAGPAGIRDWRYEGIIERGGEIFLIGPHLPGLSLEKVLPMPAGKALPLMGRLARALLQVSQGGAGWFPLQSDSVIFTDEGGVLFLPPRIDRELRDLRSFEATRETFGCLNHPDLAGERMASFSICAALYRIVTGRFPFMGADPADLHEQVRRLEIQPPAGLVPGLDEEVSETIMAGLGRGGSAPVSFAEISQGLERWGTRDLVHPLSEELRQSALATAGAREASAERSFLRRRFWQRNWRVAAVAAVVVVLLGALGGTILRNVLAPRVTRGYPPRRVVEAFYSSMNTLDHATMQACVVGPAGRGEIDQTTTLYVTSRVTQGYEGRSNVMSAAEWDKAGRPPLTPPATLYGVTGLSVSEEQGEPLPVFLVKYDKWNPAAPADSAVDAGPRSEGHAVTDRVWMKMDRGDWVISRIDRLESRELPPPATGPAA
ncbi:MAG: hypothetical protein ACLQDL_08365 [Spirochaetia bacterium]